MNYSNFGEDKLGMVRLRILFLPNSLRMRVKVGSKLSQMIAAES